VGQDAGCFRTTDEDSPFWAGGALAQGSRCSSDARSPIVTWRNACNGGRAVVRILPALRPLDLCCNREAELRDADAPWRQNRWMLAQRIRSTSEVNQLSGDAVARARSRRERTLVGLHPLGFYDG
jgi:hypothetical protein